MLDVIEKVAMDLLAMSKNEVQHVRDALLEEVVQDEARYAARTALKHPEGSTTPLNEAADRSQQAYAKVRERMMKELPRLLSLILAEQVARQQRDEAAVARDRHWDAEFERRAVGPHPETRDLFGRLFKHGVTPWHLKALRDEEVAVIADLIRWKANDARHEKADTPWRAVLMIYAERLILKADYGVSVKRSKVGTPVRGKRHTSPKHYMFNEMVKPHWSKPAVGEVSAADEQGEGVHSDERDHDVGLAVEGGGGDNTPAMTPMLNAIVEDAAASKEAIMAIEVGDMPKPAHAAEIQIGDDEAHAMAEAIYVADRLRIGIYWPSDISEGIYDPSILIPALERIVGSDRNWSGAKHFLDAARGGQARQFIEDRRAWGIKSLAGQLQAGDEKAIAAARKFGLLP